jgi:hypothetical protein
VSWARDPCQNGIGLLTIDGLSLAAFALVRGMRPVQHHCSFEEGRRGREPPAATRLFIGALELVRDVVVGRDRGVDGVPGTAVRVDVGIGGRANARCAPRHSDGDAAA